MLISSRFHRNRFTDHWPGSSNPLVTDLSVTTFGHTDLSYSIRTVWSYHRVDNGVIMTFYIASSYQSEPPITIIIKKEPYPPTHIHMHTHADKINNVYYFVEQKVVLVHIARSVLPRVLRVLAYIIISHPTTLLIRLLAVVFMLVFLPHGPHMRQRQVLSKFFFVNFFLFPIFFNIRARYYK